MADKLQVPPPRPELPEWRTAAVDGPLLTLQQYSNDAGEDIFTLKKSDATDVWVSRNDGTTHQTGFAKVGSYPTAQLPLVTAADVGAIAFDTTRNVPVYVNASLAWQPWATSGPGTGGGTVTDVGLDLPGEFVEGPHVSASGLLSAVWASQAQRLVLASPVGAPGLPAFRALTAADLPAGVSGTDSSGHTIVVSAATSRSPLLGTPGFQCDGNADDVEINAAIQAAKLSNGVVRLLEGTYNCAAPILLNGNTMTLEGVGVGSILKRAYNEATAGSGLVVVTGAQCRLANFSVDGTKSSFPEAGRNHGVHVTGGAQDCRFESLNLHDNSGYGLSFLNAGVRHRAQLLRTFNNTWQGVGVVGTLYVTLINPSSTSDVGAVFANNASGLGVQGALAFSGLSTVPPFWFKSSQGLRLSDCYADTAPANVAPLDGAFLLQNCSAFTLDTCSIGQSLGPGFHVTDGNRGNFVDCSSTFAAGSGLLLDGNSQDVQVALSRFLSGSRYGIEIASTCHNIRVGPNILDVGPSGGLTGNTLGPILDSVLPTSPDATLYFGSGGQFRSVAGGAPTLSGRERYIDCDATTGQLVLTLPAPTTALRGWIFTVKKIDLSNNPVRIVPAGTPPGTIDGGPNVTLGAPWATTTIYCTGTDYRLLTPPNTTTGGGAATNVPLGGIIMWSGSIASIPAGWALCNGQTVQGPTGALQTPNLQDRFVMGAGGTLSPQGGGLTHAHAFQDGATTGPEAAHTHHLTNGFVSGTATPSLSAGQGLNSPAAGTALTVSALSHTHPVDISGTTDAGSSHTHPLPGGTKGNVNNDALPPYLALAYIMRYL